MASCEKKTQIANAGDKSFACCKQENKSLGLTELIHVVLFLPFPLKPRPIFFILG